MQLATPVGVWLIDPLALPDLTPLVPVFAGQSPVVVVHAGDNDLSHLKRRYGFAFRSIFDTSIAARFVGATSLGLDTLLETWLGVTLPPSRQRDDWSVRPLAPGQIDYAAADVRHLFALKERLTQELRARGRLAWMEEECAALAAQIVPERVVDPDAYLGVKGARELSPRGLAILRELWALRESLARAADRPPFKILSEDILLAIAPPVGLSARNVIPGRIVALEQRDVIISARVNCGVEMEVHLTLAARDALEVQPGRDVWLVIKTHSCHLMQG